MEVSDSSSRVLDGLLEARTGQQLTSARRWRIETALKGLLRAEGIETLDSLVIRLVADRDNRLGDAVVEALLNNETFFFRDRAPFELLRDKVFPAMREARARERRLSIWCAGVSTGQEAYSLAMIFAEERERWAGWTIDILGTDVSRSAVERAKDGLYTQFEVQRGLPIVKMVEWFEADGADWRIAAALRRDVRFEVHSILDAPPRPGRFDLILCRNLLLYFCPGMRRAAFDRLAQAMAPDGGLMLGAGETVIGQTESFAADSGVRGLYRLQAEPAASRLRAVNA